MALLILSFISGVLTVTAPCILPLLPVIVGGSLNANDPKAKKSWYRPLIITSSLAASVVIFTLLLKATTALLGIPQMTWQVLSGVIIVLLGVNILRPSLWEHVPLVNKLNLVANKALGSSYQKSSVKGDILVGASLGPVFNSCSPTYALVVATVLPTSFAEGLVYLSAYAIGLAGALLMIAYAGQSVVKKFGWLNNPGNHAKLIIGSLFILVGFLVLFGLDKKIQSYVLERGWYDPISDIEQSLR